MNTQRRRWFRAGSQHQGKGSVVPAVLSRVILCGAFGFVISSVQSLQNIGISVALPIWSGLIPALVIGLLLMFRTITAYERFRESRKSWGALVNTVRNLARHIWVAIKENHPDDRYKKIATLRLLVAFAVATKLHLREEPVNSELEPLLLPERYLKLQRVENSPLQLALWIGDYLQKQHERKYLNSYQLVSLHKLLDNMVNSLGTCERIIKTPIPLAYGIHLKQLVLIYCLSLPFQLVNYFQWFTGVVVALITFALLGIEEVDSEIENSFGYDYCDLPLDANCHTLLSNIQELIAQEPSVRNVPEFDVSWR